MSDLTKHGVAYDLERTPFYVERNGAVFFFSSLSHKEKFCENMRIKEDWLCDSLSRRFHYKVDVRLLADLQLYDRIEKRGFRIEYNGEVYRCHQDVELDGMTIRLKCSKEQLPNTTEPLIG